MTSSWKADVGRSAETASRYDLLVRDARESVVRHDFEAARTRLGHAVDEDARRPEAFNLLGVIEEVRGDHVEARACWRMALALNPGYGPALQNLRQVTQHPRPHEGLSLG